MSYPVTLTLTASGARMTVARFTPRAVVTAAHAAIPDLTRADVVVLLAETRGTAADGKTTTIEMALAEWVGRQVVGLRAPDVVPDEAEADFLARVRTIAAGGKVARV